MSDLNVVVVSGRLTRDSEFKSLPSGTSVLEFGLAINRKFKDKEETTFVDVTAFGKQAETLSQYLEKGKYVLVNGRLRLESWETDGQKRSKLTMVADSINLVPRESVGETVSAGSKSSSLDVNVEADVPF